MITLHWILFFLACSVSMILGYFIYALMYMASRDSTATDDYIDWSKVPEGWDYVGINGKCPVVYMSKTKMKHDGFWLSSKDDSGTNAPSDAIIGPLPPWRESLRKRPGK